MKIKICTGASCKKKYSKYITKRIENDIKFFNLKNIEIEETPCMGMCKIGPNVKIDNEILNKATPIKTSEKIFNKLKK